MTTSAVVEGSSWHQICGYWTDPMTIFDLNMDTGGLVRKQGLIRERPEFYNRHNGRLLIRAGHLSYAYDTTTQDLVKLTNNTGAQIQSAGQDAVTGVVAVGALGGEVLTWDPDTDVITSLGFIEEDSAMYSAYSIQSHNGRIWAAAAYIWDLWTRDPDSEVWSKVLADAGTIELQRHVNGSVIMKTGGLWYTCEDDGTTTGTTVQPEDIYYADTNPGYDVDLENALRADQYDPATILWTPPEDVEYETDEMDVPLVDAAMRCGAEDGSGGVWVCGNDYSIIVNINSVLSREKYSDSPSSVRQSLRVTGLDWGDGVEPVRVAVGYPAANQVAFAKESGDGTWAYLTSHGLVAERVCELASHIAVAHWHGRGFGDGTSVSLYNPTTAAEVYERDAIGEDWNPSGLCAVSAGARMILALQSKDGTEDGEIHVVDVADWVSGTYADGLERTIVPVVGDYDPGPVVAVGGDLFVGVTGASGATAYCFGASTGEKQWETTLPATAFTNAMVREDRRIAHYNGKVYVQCAGDTLYAIDVTDGSTELINVSMPGTDIVVSDGIGWVMGINYVQRIIL